MSEERRKILEMLSDGKITVDEAEKLLVAISSADSGVERDSTRSQSTDKSLPKYLRVLVEPGAESGNGERVNIRVPLKLVRAGLKLASFVPKHAQTKVNEALSEKGIDMDFSKITSKDLDELISHLDDLSVDIDGEEKVRIFCE